MSSPKAFNDAGLSGIIEDDNPHDVRSHLQIQVGIPSDKEAVRREFLKDLPPSTGEYTYIVGMGIEGIEEIVKKEVNIFERNLSKMDDQLSGTLSPSNPALFPSSIRSEYIIFDNIPPGIANILFDDKPRSLPGKPDSWSSRLKILLIKMPTDEHEAAAHWFEHHLIEELDNMANKLSYKLRLRGARTVQGSDKEKEPDLSYRPKILPEGRSEKWPNLVVEVGYTETGQQLEKDAKWWLQESEGDVKMAITVNIWPSHKRLYFETWSMGGSIAHPRPNKTQEIMVVKQKEKEPIVTGHMIIPFADLFLREPVGTERDIKFSEDVLAHIAGETWE